MYMQVLAKSTLMCKIVYILLQNAYCFSFIKNYFIVQTNFQNIISLPLCFMILTFAKYLMAFKRILLTIIWKC